MKIESHKFQTAMQYIEMFGRPDTPVMFTPRGDRIEISIKDHAYAEYWVQTIEPLQDRFAVPLRCLPQIARECGDDDLVYRKASDAKFESAGREWWIYPVDLPDDHCPEVKIHSSMTWNNALVPFMKLAKSTTRTTDHQGCFDCIQVQHRRSRKSIMSSNGKSMTICGSPAEGGIDCSVIIDRIDVDRVAKTCFSGSSITIDVGLSHYSVQCGRRRAVFGIREGVFQNWHDTYDTYRRIARNQHGTYGVATFEKAQLIRPVRQASVDGHALSFEGVAEGVEIRGVNRSSKVVADVGWTGRFGPVFLDAKSIDAIASTWPHDELKMVYSEPSKAIVFCEPEKARGLVSLLMPSIAK